MKLISFVFSFRNEEKNLKNLIQRIDKAVKKTELWDYELIFVNDDSTDNSENLLLDLQKEYKIKIINMSRRFGTNPCVLAGFENCSVLELANTVKNIIGEDVILKSQPTNDNRSYHISSKKIKKILGFETIKTTSDAVKDLRSAFEKGLLPNSLTDEKYFNIKR